MRNVLMACLLLVPALVQAAEPNPFRSWEQVKVWDSIISYEGNRFAILGMDLSPDGNTLGVVGQVRSHGASFSWTLPVYEDGEPQLLGMYSGGGVWGASTIQFDPAGERAVVFDKNQQRVHVHRLLGREEEPSFVAGDSNIAFTLFHRREPEPPSDTMELHPAAAAILQQLRYVTAGKKEGVFQLWSEEGSLLTTLPGHTEKQGTAWIPTLVFNPDGTVLASTGFDATVRLTSFLPESFGQQIVLPGRFSTQSFPETYDEIGRSLSRYAGGLSLAWSTDGTTLAAGGGDGTVLVYREGQLVGHFTAHRAYILGLTFHPYSNNLLATGGHERVVRLWDVSALPRKDPRLLKELESLWHVADVKFTLNGRALLVAGMDQGIFLFGGQDALTPPTRDDLYKLEAIRTASLPQ